MKKSFTLIEVLVAVLIFFLVSVVVFNVLGNTKFLLEKIKENQKFSLISSIVFIERKGKNLYESLTDFNITNDEIIKTLKKYNISLKTTNDLSEDINVTDKSINFYINKIKAYNKYQSAYIYELGIK